MASRRENIFGILLPLSGLIAMLFMFYAFLQKAEADKQREYSDQQRQMNIIREVKIKAAEEKIHRQDSLIKILQQELVEKKKK